MDHKRLIFLLGLAYSSTLALEPGEGNVGEAKRNIHHPPECDLAGWWRGDSHSFMQIVEDLPRGQTIEFEGILTIPDANAHGALPGQHPTTATLRGARSKNQTNSFGFVVSYKGGGTGVWVGQCLPDLYKEYLETVFLFRTPTEYEDQWSATRVGKDKWIKVEQPEWYRQS